MTKFTAVQARVVTTKSVQSRDSDLLQQVLNSTNNNGRSIDKLTERLEGVETVVKDLEKGFFERLLKVLGLSWYITHFCCFSSLN